MNIVDITVIANFSCNIGLLFVTSAKQDVMFSTWLLFFFHLSVSRITEKNLINFQDGQALGRIN